MNDASDFNFPPQEEIEGRIRLTDVRGEQLKELVKAKVHIGEPIGDNIVLFGVRIALRRVRSNTFDGIVPDGIEGLVEKVRSLVTKNKESK
jgi:hypothetical protein